jgi:hypothetical protein
MLTAHFFHSKKMLVNAISNISICNTSDSILGILYELKENTLIADDVSSSVCPPVSSLASAPNKLA